MWLASTGKAVIQDMHLLTLANTLESEHQLTACAAINAMSLLTQPRFAVNCSAFQYNQLHALTSKVSQGLTTRMRRSCVQIPCALHCAHYHSPQ
jgi:hypothetical protein